jgi:putative ABC transport system permease protein
LDDEEIMKGGWRFRVALRAAWACLWQHRWRSLCTLLTCGLGTTGLLLAGLLHAAQVDDVRSRLRNMGGRLLVVSPNKLPAFPGRPRQLPHFISLEPDDAVALAAGVPDLQHAVSVTARDLTVQCGPRAARVRLIGTTPDYLSVRGFTLDRGRFLAAADQGERVIVLGHSIHKELGAEEARPGSQIFVGPTSYTVVGVLTPQGVNFAGEDEDHQVFIPLDTYCRRVANRPWLHYLYVQLSAEADAAATVRQVKELLRARHGRWRDQVDDVVVRDLADIAAKESDLLTTVAWAVSFTSGLLLLTGGVGIATLMALMVRERRIEIGLRQALGATAVDVGLQFFLEGMALATAGVLAGMAVGLIAMTILTRTLALSADVDFTLPLLSAVVSLLCGAVACVFPALLATRLEPGVVLRA